MQREATREYLKGALWAYPSLAVVLSLATGSVLSHIQVPKGSWLDPLLFQGTADDARTLLIGISGTMMTVIALVLGLTVVALQLSSTQYSPRLLRNFLRDRTNQLVLSVFVATFTYSTAGLYTVGVDAGRRTDVYPRLAVTLAVVLLFASLIVLVYFAHHIAHSIQVDAVMRRVEQTTLRVVELDLRTTDVVHRAPEPPAWAVRVPALSSGYVQTIVPDALVGPASAADLVVSITPMVGEHVVKGSALAWLWRARPDLTAPDPAELAGAVQRAVRIGFERTAEQDVAFGVRQLADIAVKALSPAINDPYTAIQSVDHLSVVLTALAQRPLGHRVLEDATGTGRVVVHGRDLAYFLDLAVGQVRRYGRTDPRVLKAVLRILVTVGTFCVDDQGRATVATQVRLVRLDAEAGIAQPDDLAPVVARAEEALGGLAPRGLQTR